MRAAAAVATMGRRTVGATIEALIILAIVATLAFGFALATGTDPGGQSALAARGGKGSITVPDGVFGGTTTATVNPGGSAAIAYARCYQGGIVVYAQYVGVDASNQATFQLGPTPLWRGGSASCTAQEGYFSSSGRWRALASTTFNVSG